MLQLHLCATRHDAALKLQIYRLNFGLNPELLWRSTEVNRSIRKSQSDILSYIAIGISYVGRRENVDRRNSSRSKGDKISETLQSKRFPAVGFTPYLECAYFSLIKCSPPSMPKEAIRISHNAGVALKPRSASLLNLQPDNPPLRFAYHPEDLVPFQSLNLLFNRTPQDILTAMELKWKVADKLTARAQKKPKTEWEKHKEDIINFYQTSSLNGLVHWMIDTHDFWAR